MTFRHVRILFIFLIIISPVRPIDTRAQATDGEQAELADIDGPGENSGAVRYQIQLSGIDNIELQEKLQTVINLSLQEQVPPQSTDAIERRIPNHIQTLQSVMRAQGYYGASMSDQIDFDKLPAIVDISISTGPLFRLKEFRIVYSGPGMFSELLPASMGEIGVDTGGAAESDIVIQAEEKLFDHLANNGHPLAVLSDRIVIVDHEDQSMTVTFEIEPGPVSRFGLLNVEQLQTVEKEYVTGFMPWKAGEIYDQNKVNLLQSGLLDTGLFDSVVIQLADSLDENGELAITVALTERKHRSIGLEALWSTDEGFGGEVFWQHRNLFGKQERLTFTARMEEIRQELDLSYRKPRFYLDNQSLLAGAILAYEDTDAYEGPRARVSVGLEEKLANVWTLTPGLWVEHSNLQDFQGKRKFDLYGASFRFNRNTADDVLDPGQGARLDLSLLPFRAEPENGEALDLLQMQFSAVGYYSLDSRSQYILATRAKIGSVADAPSADLPANMRFYAGGGSSIRGYAYQSVGPVSDDGTPIGGRSLFEVGTELRVKINSTLGMVGFVEGGNVFEDTTPQISENLRWAAGLGVRYFTAIGPIRVDFGFPLDKRPQDDSFQFYISVGQAF